MSDKKWKVAETSTGTTHLVDREVDSEIGTLVMTRCGRLLRDYDIRERFTVERVMDFLEKHNPHKERDLHIIVVPDGAKEEEFAFVRQTTRRGRCANCCTTVGPIRKKYADRKGIDYSIPGVDD